MSHASSPTTITAAELAAALAAGEPLVTLQVTRHRPGDEPVAPPVGWIPGAHAVDFAELVGEPSPGAGDSPLPGEAQLRALVERWGLHDDSTVVVYSTDHASSATRVWWVLRWAGVQDVRFLDGGLDAWVAHGGELRDDPPAVGGGTATLRLGSLPVLDADDAGRLARSGHLLDARPAHAYEGRVSAADGRPTGHVPGAVSAPVRPGAYLGDRDELLAAYGPYLDGASIGAYCGSGVAATVTVLALSTLGVDAALYPGSWSAWSTESLPVAQGADRG